MINYRAHGAVIRALYEDRADIIDRSSTVKNDRGETVVVDTMAYTDIRCRLSLARTDKTDEGQNYSVTSRADLYTDANIRIPEGAKVIVRHAGQEITYDQCLLKMAYDSHNEYELSKGEVTL